MLTFHSFRTPTTSNHALSHAIASATHQLLPEIVSQETDDKEEEENKMPVPFSAADFFKADRSEAAFAFEVNVWRLSEYLDYIEEYVMQDFELRQLDRVCFHTDTVTHERTFLFRGPPQPRLQYHNHVIICLRGFLAVQQWKRDAEFSRQVKAERDQHSVKTSTIDNNQKDNDVHHSNHEMEKDDPNAQLLSPTTTPTKKPKASASKRSNHHQHHKVDKATPRATRERKAKKHFPLDFNVDLEEDKDDGPNEEQDSKGGMSEGLSQLKLVKQSPSKSPATKPYRPEFPNLPSGKEWYAKHPEAKQEIESKISKAAIETAAKEAAMEATRAAEHDAAVEELKKNATTRGEHVRPVIRSPKKFNTKPIAPLPNPLGPRKTEK